MIGSLLALALAPQARPAPLDVPRPGLAVHSSVGPPPVTARPPNPKGRVPILMYHRIGPKEKYMVRSAKNFRRDLERLHRLGFRPVTLAEYVDGEFDLPPGASPVVITFDDSDVTQFRLRKDGTADPASAVGIWRDFAAENPDFPIKATWFVLPNGPWQQRGLGRKKARVLVDWGSEIAAHTMTHRPLNAIPDQDVKREMAESMRYVKRLTGRAARTLALPYGNVPKNRRLLHGFTYQGERYAYEAVVVAGSAPAPSPLNPDRNLKLLPRVWAYEGVYGIGWWLDRVERGQTKPFVTD